MTRETWTLDEEEPDWYEYLRIVLGLLSTQPYYQLKNEIYKEFDKITGGGESVIVYYDYYMYKYEVKEDENIFTIFCYDEYDDDDWYIEDEYEYVITGTNPIKISVISTYYGSHGWEAVKVPDSEVAGAIPASELN